MLERGPGEPLRDRGELGGAGRPGATLATFAQITDAHVRDEESPARVPFLDRLGGVFSPVFRPQEALTAQVLAASVRSLNRLHPQAVAVTGDLADNAQANELDTARAVLSGGRVHPDSGATGYDGVQEAGNPDPFYYRPDDDPPRHPDLLAAAQRAFARARARRAVVPGARQPRPARPGRSAADARDPGRRDRRPHGRVARPRGAARRRARTPRRRSPRCSRAACPGARATVPADPARAPPQPVGDARGGCGRRGRDGDRLDYSFDIGASVRGIVLDVVDRDGGERGLVTPAQVAWLRARAAPGRPALRRRLLPSAADAVRRRRGGAARARCRAARRRRDRRAPPPQRDHPAPLGPYWLVETASLADFPQQARFFRLVRTAGGGVALETWMVDQDGAGLAGISRELAFLDAQGGRPQGFVGRREDRNARLRLP